MINDLTNKTKTSSMTNDMLNDSAICFNDLTTKRNTAGWTGGYYFSFHGGMAAFYHLAHALSIYSYIDGWVCSCIR